VPQCYSCPVFKKVLLHFTFTTLGNEYYVNTYHCMTLSTPWPLQLCHHSCSGGLEALQLCHHSCSGGLEALQLCLTAVEEDSRAYSCAITAVAGGSRPYSCAITAVAGDSGRCSFAWLGALQLSPFAGLRSVFRTSLLNAYIENVLTENSTQQDRFKSCFSCCVHLFNSQNFE